MVRFGSNFKNEEAILTNLRILFCIFLLIIILKHIDKV